MIALVLIDKRGNVNSHAVTLDCERNYINFGYGEDSDGQIVLHFAGPPGKGDRQDVATVKSVMVQYFKDLRDIIVADVMQVFVRAKALRYAPGAAYVIEGRKSDGGDDGRGGKRARVPPSHGRAFSSDEDGDGPVQPAIDSIQEDALRAYAEQQTEQMLQRLLRENPSHASFADRLRELHAPVDDGQSELVEYVKTWRKVAPMRWRLVTAAAAPKVSKVRRVSDLQRVIEAVMHNEQLYWKIKYYVRLHDIHMFIKQPQFRPCVDVCMRALYDIDPNVLHPHKPNRYIMGITPNRKVGLNIYGLRYDTFDFPRQVNGQYVIGQNVYGVPTKSFSKYGLIYAAELNGIKLYKSWNKTKMWKALLAA